MMNIIKVLFFVIVNAVGFYAIPIFANVAVLLDVYPEFFSGTKQFDDFNRYLYSYGIGLWGLGALASVGYFFAQNEIKTWLILAPLYVPSIYGIGTILYFNFFHSAV